MKILKILFVVLVIIILVSVVFFLFHLIFSQNTNVEIITSNAAIRDNHNEGDNAWGGHQTRIMRTNDGVFTAYITRDSKGFEGQLVWELAWKKDDEWHVAAKGLVGKEQPMNLLASPDGTIHVIAWPENNPTMWSGKPISGVLNLETEILDFPTNHAPYCGAGIDGEGNICVAMCGTSPLIDSNIPLACYDAKNDVWNLEYVPVKYRHCYTYVFPKSDGGLSLVSNRDVHWEDLGYEVPEGEEEFGYVFNKVSFWHRDRDPKNNPLKLVAFLEELPTQKYPDAKLKMNDYDAYFDTKERMHIIYSKEGASTKGMAQRRHAMFSNDGELLKDERLPLLAGGKSVIFQDDKERFYILSASNLPFPSARLYSAGNDGFDLGFPRIYNLKGNDVEYSGFAISAPRTGTPLSNIMDVGFPSDDGKEWVYFRIVLYEK